MLVGDVGNLADAWASIRGAVAVKFLCVPLQVERLRELLPSRRGKSRLKGRKRKAAAEALEAADAKPPSTPQRQDAAEGQLNGMHDRS